MDNNVIKLIDDHIKCNMKLSDFKPSFGYVDFVEKNETIIFTEIKFC